MPAWLDGAEPAATHVEATLDRGPVMSWINLGEVAHQVSRWHGADAAGEVVARRRAMLVLDPATPERVMEAAALRARIPMAFADCFAAATATAHGCVLLTGDPELIDAAGPGCPVMDVRRTP